jgi:hypothetical protein
MLCLARGAAAMPGPGGRPVVVKEVSWAETAISWRGQNGKQVTVDCPARGKLGSLWGTFIYTDDSSICSSAVHAGAISVAAGGRVVIEIRAGEPSYGASVQNGASSGAWGAWTGSFVILSATPLPPPSGPPSIEWSDSPATLRLGDAPATLLCPSAGSAHSVWGSGVYTDDSSICTAGVHAGVITVAGGGPVTVARQPGATGYGASTANGITTETWGAWSGSFVVVTAPSP